MGSSHAPQPPEERRDLWGRHPAWIAVVIALLVAVPAVIVLVEPATTMAPGPGSPGLLYEFSTHISHIVFVVLENHAFDNYYGTYCLQVGPVCPDASAGLPNGLCVPVQAGNPAAGCVRPFPYTPRNWTINAPLPHTWNASVTAWDNGRMDGFYAAERSGQTPFGYYNGSTAPIFWDLAQQYALADNFYTSILSYSLPNHWHIVAGQSPEAMIKRSPGYGHGFNPGYLQNDRAYLREANATPTIEDLVAGTSVSWKYYNFPLPDYSAAITDTPQKTGLAFALWNPLAAPASSYTPSNIGHFVRANQFFDDARNGTLPAISWVIPAGQVSDHPPANSTVAQGWTASLVDAVESSPQWTSTLMLVTWDDYGGFYDHVTPPLSPLGQPLGFRVPLLLISPYTRPGAIDSEFGYFESILHLMEWRFGLGCLTALDCLAPLPLASFDFSATARAPILFPTSVANASYPMPPIDPASAPLPTFYPPAPYVSFPSGPAPDVD